MIFAVQRKHSKPAALDSVEVTTKWPQTRYKIKEFALRDMLRDIHTPCTNSRP